MSIKSDILQLLAADAPLMALLQGGIYDRPQLAPGMDAPHPFDEVGRVRPSALVRNETAATVGPRGRFSQAFIVVFFYDHAGYDAITPAAERARQVLHGRYIGDGAYEVRHTDDVLDQYDDAILAYMHRSRYQVARYRG